MSLRRTIELILAAAAATCLVGLLAMPAAAAPSAAQTSADRAAVDHAVTQYDAAQQRSADINARIAEASAELDRLVAQENQARSQLRSRVSAMYRSPDSGFVSVLLGASSFEDFVTRWDLLTRVARQNAESLRTLKTARAEAERSAEELIDLQADAARAVDALAEEVTRAKSDLASSEAALREYQARTAAASAKSAAAKPAPVSAPAPSRADPTQQLTGVGAWQTAVASHYSIDFTGRGASGEEIGPYSMIVAHRTLPFGTLVEFEYNGKRAVARVADRGPHTEGREFDLGPGVARVLGFSGVHEVRYRIISQ